MCRIVAIFSANWYPNLLFGREIKLGFKGEGGDWRAPSLPSPFLSITLFCSVFALKGSYTQREREREREMMIRIVYPEEVCDIPETTR